MKAPAAFVAASGARALTVVLLALRAKAVAVLLGPEGTGLLGLFTAAQEIGAQASDAGLGHSAIRQVARTSSRPARAARLRRALAIAVIALAALGALATWAARAPLSRLLTGTEAHATDIAILALGLFLAVLCRWRQALLTGYRRLGALAGGTVLGTAAATAAGIAAIWALGRDGLAWAAVAAPAAGLVSLLAVSRLPRAGPVRGPLVRDWAVLFRLGLSLMVVAQMALLAPMILRVWLTHQSGLAEAGLFQAAWTISAQIMAVLLMAVSVDFYPRISAMTGDPAARRAALERQVRLHLAVGGPVLLATAGAAPAVLALLYSEAFRGAAALLQGLALGGLARLVSAPLETVLTAAGRPRRVLVVSTLSLALLLALSVAGAGRWGLAAIGAAFALVQVLQLALIALAAQRHAALAPDRPALLWLGGLLAGGVAIVATESTVAWVALAAAAGLAPMLAAREALGLYRRLGETSTSGRRASAALNRLKVWLT